MTHELYPRRNFSRYSPVPTCFAIPLRIALTKMPLVSHCMGVLQVWLWWWIEKASQRMEPCVCPYLAAYKFKCFATLGYILRCVHQNNIYECVLIAGCIHLHIIGIPDIMIARYVLWNHPYPVLHTLKLSLQLYSEGSQWARRSILSCGLHHAAMLRNGDLYTWGATKNGKWVLCMQSMGTQCTYMYIYINISVVYIFHWTI